jgi:hypothetical protein
METFATPGTPSRRGRIVQRASTDTWIGDSSLEDRPTIITRLVDDSGCIIAGGLATCGRPADCVRRSVTTCRARSRSVPGSKMSSTLDSPGIDSERIVSSHATPLSRSCSSGTVISSSTSAADRPRASVWTSTVGGANSGRTSTGVLRSCVTPKSSRPGSEHDHQAARLQARPDDPTNHAAGLPVVMKPRKLRATTARRADGSNRHPKEFGGTLTRAISTPGELLPSWPAPARQTAQKLRTD